MREHIYTAICYVFMIGAILVAFKLYKWHEKAVIEANDHSMEPEYRNGSYSLDTSPRQSADLKPGTAVAYWVPGNAKAHRVAWVIATEGQRLALAQGKVTVDGQPLQTKVLGFHNVVPEFVVPRGTVYVLASAPEEDSLKYGPIPMRNIRGVLK